MLAARAVVRARAVRVAAAGARMVVARGMRSVPALFAEAADTHDDFKPKVKVDVSDKGAVLDHIRKTVETNAVVLYMKGTPQQPMCGFSRQAVMILQAAGAKYHSVNVLESPEIRQGIKDFSEWPTIPQLFISGQFVGGSDIMLQMFNSGTLKPMLDAAKPATEVEAGAARA